jgi:hypothetical protein
MGRIARAPDGTLLMSAYTACYLHASGPTFDGLLIQLSDTLRCANLPVHQKPDKCIERRPNFGDALRPYPFGDVDDSIERPCFSIL